MGGAMRKKILICLLILTAGSQIHATRFAWVKRKFSFENIAVPVYGAFVTCITILGQISLVHSEPQKPKRLL